MKHSIGYKFFVLLVCILSLTIFTVSTVGCFIATFEGMYERSFDQNSITPTSSAHTNYLAEAYAQRYAAETIGKCPPEILDSIYESNLHMYDAKVTIMNGDTILSSTGVDFENPTVNTLSISVLFPSMVPLQDSYADSIGTWLFTIDGEYVELETYLSPVYSVTIERELTDAEHTELQLLKTIYLYRYVLIGFAVVSFAVLALFFILMCCTAGRVNGSDDIRPGGLNRMPLDIYALLTLTGEVILALIGSEFLNVFFRFSLYLTLPILSLIIFMAATMLIGFLFAFAAQVKLPGSYWWHHSMIGRCLDWGMKAIRFLFRGTGAVLRMMPIIWQWLIILFALVIGGGASLFFAMICWNDFFQLFWLAVCGLCVLTFIGVICYAGYAFGVLMKGVSAMAQGQLYYQIPTTNLIGSFRDFAVQLNTMGSAMQVAVSRQMKSERMKTELITNVSHDIKTPLTSIINYVDLLKMPHTPEAGEQYLEVLDRQSQRLKKLIDDLMELSKANSGTLAVNFSKINAAEAVNQALGEFADKLDSVGLQPVFHHPQEPVMIQADGRLLWRALSNILSNTVKYALPNTRLYMDLMVLQGNAVITVKNISREQLNVSVDELMERFVRGDMSRNTEGSGLGLNIAKTLTELQKGQMHLMVDGDLFKVTLMFPTL